MSRVRRAERKKAKLRLGLCGPSGAGKTLSALLVAYGLVRAEQPEWTEDQVWEAIGLIDTEEGSGELYAETSKAGVHIGTYLYLRLEPPFTPQRYVEAIREMEESGALVIITDSLSHAWAGTGGVLDMQGRAAMKEGNSYTAWRHVTPHHNSLVDTILRSKAHMICTLRSKTEYVIETINGKSVPRKVGMAPIQRDGMEYEFTVVLDLGMDHSASSSKDRTSLFDGQFFTVTTETGRALYEWLASGKEAPPEERPAPANTPKIPPAPTREEAQKVWNTCSKLKLDRGPHEGKTLVQVYQEEPDYLHTLVAEGWIVQYGRQEVSLQKAASALLDAATVLDMAEGA